MSTTDNPTGAGLDFVRELVRADIEAGTFDGRVQTRFPPEPNGYLHIGHAKAICSTTESPPSSAACATCASTTPTPTPRRSSSSTRSSRTSTGSASRPASRCTPATTSSSCTDWAEHLISEGHAYVDDQDGETISAQRGGYGNAGVESPYRDRPVEENLDLFRRMRAGEFADGSRVLRAKIDMQHENMQLRDPVMYRIRRGDHSARATTG